MSNYGQIALIGGLGLAIVAGTAYFFSGDNKETTTLLPNSMFASTNPSNSSSSQYINPVAPTQAPPRESPFTRTADLVTNVGGRRRSKRRNRNTKKRRTRTKRRG
jgi:hypothetical protein